MLFPKLVIKMWQKIVVVQLDCHTNKSKNKNKWNIYYITDYLGLVEICYNQVKCCQRFPISWAQCFIYFWHADIYMYKLYTTSRKEFYIVCHLWTKIQHLHTCKEYYLARSRILKLCVIVVKGRQLQCLNVNWTSI